MAYGMKYYQLRGDPGLFGSIGKFITKGIGGKLLKSIPGVGTVASLASVLPVGKLLKAGRGLASKVGFRATGIPGIMAPGRPGGFGSMMPAAGKVIGTMGRGGKFALGAGAAAAGGAALALRGGGSPGGLGSMQRALQSGRAAVDPGTGQIVRTGRRYRRMHVTNMKALNRSIRRVKGFAKVARAALVIDKRFKTKKGARGRK